MADICVQQQPNCQPLDCQPLDFGLLNLLVDSQGPQMPGPLFGEAGFGGDREQSGPESSATGSGLDQSLDGQETTAEGANAQLEGGLATAASGDLGATQADRSKRAKLDEDERKERRRLSNRISARKNRSKRMEEVKSLQMVIKTYQEENTILKAKVEGMLRTIDQLQKQIQLYHEQRFLDPQVPASAAYATAAQAALASHAPALAAGAPHMPGAAASAPADVPGASEALAVGVGTWKVPAAGMAEHMQGTAMQTHGADASMLYLQSLPYARVPSPAHMLGNGMMGMHPADAMAGAGMSAACYNPVAAYQMLS
ncbi:hypothetical protein WJX72_010363 [[Myrmecia] bisecta]|uniref:BZIP domain-containing protein n=1 Tax=[Myrmecia] bisecta TaxID=41462 RepID=A0AAW1PSL3_9CHLO